MILANGLTFKLFTFSSLMRTKAQAPSLILDELAAVIVPVLLKAGERVGILDSLYLFGS